MFALPGNLIGLILFSTFSLVALIQLLYYTIFYLKAALPGKSAQKGKNPAPVSVVICARNEADNLESFLPSVLEQEYPDFEVIVVDDCSEDDTPDILKRLSATYPNLRVTTIYKDASLAHGKKMALFLGIKAARNDLLLLTDADCQPVTSRWIEEMATGFNDGADFVLGYGGYLREKGLLNRYIRFDTAFIAMQYMGMARAGMPYMGVGRNLAYRRSLFFENRGFGPHISLQSGDDDLFINKLATAENTTIIRTPDSFPRSIPASRFTDLTMQKMRHMSTAPYYNARSRFLLLAEPISRVLFYALIATLLLTQTAWQLPLLIFGVTFLAKMIISGMVQKSLNERDLLLVSPLFDIISPFINSYFLIRNRINRNRTFKWK